MPRYKIQYADGTWRRGTIRASSPEAAMDIADRELEDGQFVGSIDDDFSHADTEAARAIPISRNR